MTIETHSRIRSFVLRQGRITKAQQQALTELKPLYGLDVAAGVCDFANIFKREAATVLEIGFGMGDSLVTQAMQQPELNFIGVEVHSPGVGNILKSIHTNKISNLRIFHNDAIDVLQQAIAPMSLAKVQIFFPDPWHKKRHHKRRLIQPEFVNLCVSRLAPRGVLHLATDWEDYAWHMLAELEANAALHNIAAQHKFMPHPPQRPLTKFEKRGQRLQHQIWDLMFSKN